MLSRLTDRLVLNPSRDPLPLEDKIAELMPYGEHKLEVLKMRVGTGEPQAYILKFGGNGSRAERAETHPGEIWPHLNAEIWAVNYPGYGNSTGRASLKAMVRSADSIYEYMATIAKGKPIIVTGNSIGTTCPLYLAANRPIAGILLRNPPPLKQLIVGHHGWWNLWLGARVVAAGVPRELDSIANAKKSQVPAVFLMSGRDRVVPPRYQEQIQHAYAGPKQIVLDPQADHSTPLDPKVEADYLASLEWLEREALPVGRFGNRGNFVA
jgi:pimeloyl-ACP methyl ester carboxylesterase